MDGDELRQLLEFVPDAMLLVHQDGTIAYANLRAYQLLGYAEHELRGLPVDALVPERFRARHAEFRDRFVAAPAVRPMGNHRDLLALRKDGRELAVEIGLGPINTPGGRLVAVLLRDLSPRRQVDMDLCRALGEVQRLSERLKPENAPFREKIRYVHGFEELVGESEALQLTLERIRQVAYTDASVLITGETGTGKELVARALHQRSVRKDHPLVKVDCAALPATLIESELFGYEKGAFTGACSRKVGLFEVANLGTAFLDEVGELPLEVQSKLLRVLQDGAFWRLGSGSETNVDVRVIAATNCDLRKAVQEQRFRMDLYFRLAVFPIEMPPLRDRREDIPHLVRHFVAKKQAALGRSIEHIPLATIQRLMDYHWPGNVRELENVIERSLILSPGNTLLVEPTFGTAGMACEPTARSQKIVDFERTHIVRVLEECHWQIKGAGMAAERLGLNPSTLHSRMKKLGIRRPDGSRRAFHPTISPSAPEPNPDGQPAL